MRAEDLDPMRLRFALLFVLAFPLAAAASEYVLPIAGSVSNFRTDVRVYNPTDSDAHLTFVFLPSGNQDNRSAFSQGVTATVPANHEVSYNDVVSTVFGASGIGGIFIDSDTVLLITARIYAQTATGTLGQGYRGLYTGNIPTEGVLLQLRADTAFRTNIGAMNIQNALVHVTWKLYDKNNAEVADATTTVPPYGVIGPTSITSLFNTGSADLSDAYVTFTADSALVVYASVIDNVTTDPTYFSAMTRDGF
jgi:hypothetical protein